MPHFWLFLWYDGSTGRISSLQLSEFWECSSNLRTILRESSSTAILFNSHYTISSLSQRIFENVFPIRSHMAWHTTFNTTPCYFICTQHFLRNGLQTQHKLLYCTFPFYHYIPCFHNISTYVSYFLGITWLNETLSWMVILAFSHKFWKGSLKSLQLNVITRHYAVTSTLLLLGKQNMFPRILRMF